MSEHNQQLGGRSWHFTSLDIRYIYIYMHLCGFPVVLYAIRNDGHIYVSPKGILWFMNECQLTFVSFKNMVRAADIRSAQWQYCICTSATVCAFELQCHRSSIFRGNYSSHIRTVKIRATFLRNWNAFDLGIFSMFSTLAALRCCSLFAAVRIANAGTHSYSIVHTCVLTLIVST